jgi:hypothetical protein
MAIASELQLSRQVGRITAKKDLVLGFRNVIGSYECDLIQVCLSPEKVKGWSMVK